MRKLMILLLLFFSIKCIAAPDLASFNVPVPIPVSVENSFPLKVSAIEFVKLKVSDVEKLTGRKLKLKEKIAFKYLQFKTKKDLKPKAKGKSSSKGQSAMVIGIIGLALAFIPFTTIASVPLAIVAIIRGSKAQKENPGDKKGKTAVVLGLITLGLFIAAVIAAIVIY